MRSTGLFVHSPAGTSLRLPLDQHDVVEGITVPPLSAYVSMNLMLRAWGSAHIVQGLLSSHKLAVTQ